MLYEEVRNCNAHYHSSSVTTTRTMAMLRSQPIVVGITLVALLAIGVERSKAPLSVPGVYAECQSTSPASILSHNPAAIHVIGTSTDGWNLRVDVQADIRDGHVPCVNTTCYLTLLEHPNQRNPFPIRVPFQLQGPSVTQSITFNLTSQEQPAWGLKGYGQWEPRLELRDENNRKVTDIALVQPSWRCIPGINALLYELNLM